MNLGIWGVIGRVLLTRVRRIAALRKLDVVGARPVVIGEPHLQNLGRMEVGDDFILVSRPIQSHVITGPHGLLRIGNGVRFEHGTAMSVDSRVTIGDCVHVGPQVIVMDSNVNELRTDESRGRSRDIVIGAGVTIGARVTILPGVTIGDGTIVEEGSVVSQSLPSYVRAAGVPAMPIDGDARSGAE